MATNFENAVRFNHAKRTIEITKSFDKASCRFGSPEYKALQIARRDYPDYRIVVKKPAKAVDHLGGLNYDFMEKYITSHDNADKNMTMFMDLRAKSEEAQLFGFSSASYGEIKAWFLRTYPEIEAFQKRREEALKKAA